MIMHILEAQKPKAFDGGAISSFAADAWHTTMQTQPNSALVSGDFNHHHALIQRYYRERRGHLGPRELLPNSAILSHCQRNAAMISVL